ncbi:MAG TPA: c-type cytochrome [Niabella sp.]|nr:c-type cytochrome [Niabella sp.]
MFKNKISLVMLLIASLLMVGFINTKPLKQRNLKVLPADISDEKLDSLMLTYNKGLGVTCDFCHVQEVKSGDTTLNFASDDNPVKEEARRMIRLTIDINQKYFNYNSKIHPAYLTRISCNTCHKGNAYPEE